MHLAQALSTRQPGQLCWGTICIHIILSSKWISPFKTHFNISFLSSSWRAGVNILILQLCKWRPGKVKRVALGFGRSGRIGTKSHFFRSLYGQVPLSPPHHTWSGVQLYASVPFLANTRKFKFPPTAYPLRLGKISQEITVKCSAKIKCCGNAEFQ